jgi:uncharacterized protein (TIGR02444 family)
MSDGLQRDNAFWRFSRAVYGEPGVAQECLDLQARYGLDVNLLLYVAWLGAVRCATLSAADIALARDRVRTWHDRAVRPLRSVRTALKPLEGFGIQDFRTKVKALELESEQIEQAMLFALARERWPEAGGGDPRQPLQTNVAALLTSYGAPDAMLAGRLIDAALRYSE